MSQCVSSSLSDSLVSTEAHCSSLRPSLGRSLVSGSARRMWVHPGSPDFSRAGSPITRTGPTPGCRVSAWCWVTASADLWQHRLYTDGSTGLTIMGCRPRLRLGGRGLRRSGNGSNMGGGRGGAVTEPRSLNFITLTDISGASCSANIFSG